MEQRISQTVQSYVKLRYTTMIECDREAGIPYLASHPELPGCMAQGNTSEEAIENLKEAQELYISSLLERGLAVPLPKSIEHDYAKNSDNTFVVDAANAGEDVPTARLEAVLTRSSITTRESQPVGCVYTFKAESGTKRRVKPRKLQR